MAKMESGHGLLLTADTEKKTMRFKEIRLIVSSGMPPAKQWEHPYGLDWSDADFIAVLGKEVRFVLSDGVVIDLKLDTR